MRAGWSHWRRSALHSRALIKMASQLGDRQPSPEERRESPGVCTNEKEKECVYACAGTKSVSTVFVCMCAKVITGCLACVDAC